MILRGKSVLKWEEEKQISGCSWTFSSPLGQESDHDTKDTIFFFG